jgi:molecular chaperone DnaK (HSP70)
MPKIVGIDFGTCNTVLAIWDPGREVAEMPIIEGVSREVRYRIGDQWHTAHVIPSLIAYEDNKVFVGNQVYDRGLSEASCTFRWMKSYISSQQPMPRRIVGVERCESEILKDTCRECAAKTDGDRICNYTAGRDFLSTILTYASDYCDLAEDEFVFTIPVDTFEHYPDWIGEVCEQAGIRRFSMIDEPTACVLGYEGSVQNNDVFVVVDFGAGTLDVSVTRVNLDSGEEPKWASLGQSGRSLGGRTITQWLYQDFLTRSEVAAHMVGEVGTQILMEIESAKEALSFQDHADVNVTDLQTARVYSADYKRADLEDIMLNHDLLAHVGEVVRAALDDARERAGVEPGQVRQALLVGGSTLIPNVRTSLQMLFGTRLAYERPFTAVAAGACRYATGEIGRFIHHSYAMEMYDEKTQTYQFDPLVPRGTSYPSEGIVARVPVTATFDGQEHFGINIYELAASRGVVASTIIQDGNGRVRVINAQGAPHHFWMNRHERTFLVARPPAMKDEYRFDCVFTLDGNRHLLITATDVKTGEKQLVDHKVVRLR